MAVVDLNSLYEICQQKRFSIGLDCILKSENDLSPLSMNQPLESKLETRLRGVLRVRHYSRNTKET